MNNLNKAQNYILVLFIHWSRNRVTVRTKVHDQRLTLPTLKFLHCIRNDDENMREDGDDGLEMLACAPLLQEVHGYRSKYLDYLGSLIQINAIKSYKHYWYESEENLTKFANAGPKLKDFEFQLYGPFQKINLQYPALIKILESSQNTLRNLRFNDAALLFDFPVLTSLKSLTIDVLPVYFRCFSKNFERLTKTKPKPARTSCFPSVETITIVYGENDYVHSPEFYVTFLEVKTLNLIHLRNRYSVGIAKMYPNITALRIEWRNYSNGLFWIAELFESVEEAEFIGLNWELEKECDFEPWSGMEMDMENDVSSPMSCHCIKRFVTFVLKSKCKSIFISSSISSLSPIYLLLAYNISLLCTYP